MKATSDHHDAVAAPRMPASSFDRETPYPVAEPARPASPRTEASFSPVFFTLPRIVAVIAFWAALHYLGPYLLERYHYSAARGRQRAEYEIASEGLQTLPLEGLSKAFQMVSLRVSPSVVHIDVSGPAQDDWPQNIHRRLGPRYPDSLGQGSGVIVDPDGYIVTNQHVIQGASAIQVSLSDGRTLPARVIGADTKTDLAVLRIQAHGLPAAEWGDSDSLEVGALVWAVGSPFGLKSTTTSGVLSGKHRAGLTSQVYQDFLQTDAAVNPGNSGGPLVDARGRVVGINTAILGEAYQGVSFAIPSRVAEHVYQRLRRSGYVARGWLGVELREVTEEDRVRLGLHDTRGAWVVRCHDDPGLPSPAGRGGIRADDVIIRWGDQPIQRPEQLIRMVAATEVGAQIEVRLRRDGEEIRLSVEVAERPVNLRS